MDEFDLPVKRTRDIVGISADRYSLAPALISDNGTQLVTRSFKQFLNTPNIEHIRIAVRHPEYNGKIEVFHKTVKHERIYIRETYQTFYESKDDVDD